MSKVLITGANGYVAQHIIGQLLELQKSVIGTVRSESKREKLLGQFFEKFGKDVPLEIVIVKDIGSVGAFNELFQNHKDIVHVLHTASPFSESENNEDFENNFKKPAVEGTTNVLNSIKMYAPQVSKVVVTSSMAAIMNFDKVANTNFTHTEDVWNPMEWEESLENWTYAYCTSKKLAEKAAWDFVKDNKVNFSLTVINPPYIFGPQYFEEDAKSSTLNTSPQVIKSLLHTDPEDTHLFNDPVMVCTDVRDIAAFHIIPLENSGIEGTRLLPISERFTGQKILNLINEQFPELDGKIAKGDPENEESIQAITWDNSKTMRLIGGYDFIPLKKQVYDTVKQILG